MSRRGVLLVNLGTPEAPEPGPVRDYLREFLGDRRVIDINPIVHWLLLHGILLRFRPRKSAEAYAQVWTDEGSPLLVESRAQAEAVAERLGPDYEVVLAMRYGRPSLAEGVAALRAARVDEILVAPLFPQYATAVTASILAKVFELAREAPTPPIAVLPPFYDDPGFIAGWVAAAAPGLRAFAPDHVLLSFHGLPESQVRAIDPTAGHCLGSPDCCERPGPSLPTCYRAQCYATGRALAAGLELAPGTWTTCFQSRLAGPPWIRPFTDEQLPGLAERGVKRLAVLCPAFVADCLETLEEIGMRLREDWEALGGELWLAPCPNATPEWVEALAALVRDHPGALEETP